MKQRKSKWVVCERQEVLKARTAVPVELAVVTEAALNNGTFSRYLQRRNRTAFDLGFHKESFDGRVDLSKLPTVKITGGEAEAR